MGLKLMSKGPLHHITKCSIAVVVALGHSLVVGVMILAQEAVGSSVEVEGNIFDIRDSSTSCMLLIRQQSLFNKQQ